MTSGVLSYVLSKYMPILSNVDLQSSRHVRVGPGIEAVDHVDDQSWRLGPHVGVVFAEPFTTCASRKDDNLRSDQCWCPACERYDYLLTVHPAPCLGSVVQFPPWKILC